jgi:hypothetical protein
MIAPEQRRQEKTTGQGRERDREGNGWIHKEVKGNETSLASNRREPLLVSENMTIRNK